MGKILGIDLGTSSIGLFLRDTDLGNKLVDQSSYYSVNIFKQGVGVGKSGEYSFATERRKHRSSRRLYQVRRYRIWATLEVLIKNGFCPLTLEELKHWRTYDKRHNLNRSYPINCDFERWIRLDFDGDGVADYSSPYQLRKALVHEQFNLTIEQDRYKIGRALYHIAQRRGFRSSKGESISEANEEKEEETISLKRSEEKKSHLLTEYIKTNQLNTVGEAFATLEQNGVRVRASEYQAVRTQYKEEIEYIFSYQTQLKEQKRFYQDISNAIFFQRPLRSQKGTIGKCTFETDKKRCPISHPEFEKFRAWTLINSILIRDEASGAMLPLTQSLKEELYQKKFLTTKRTFSFDEIRKHLEKTLQRPLQYSHNKKEQSINYPDNTTVAGCPISGRLQNLLGNNWEQWNYVSEELKHGRAITYTAYDLWHIGFTFDDEEWLEEFATSKLNFDNTQYKSLLRLCMTIGQGYGMLSLKAIENINRFLTKGLIYPHAALLAKMPQLVGEAPWQAQSSAIETLLNDLTCELQHIRSTHLITNTLIAQNKAKEIEEQSGWKDVKYQLTEEDYDNIQTCCIENYGKNSWNLLCAEAQQKLVEEVADKFQSYFSTSKREYYVIPNMKEFFIKKIKTLFPEIPANRWRKLYHPSQIDLYPKAKDERFILQDKTILAKQLPSPIIGAIKNPMAMRTLHQLRDSINQLLKDGLIDEDTRIVVEVARDLNDSNKRWAINTYNKEKEDENKKIAEAIQDYYADQSQAVNPTDIERVRLLLEQSILHGANNTINFSKEAQKYKNLITQYSLWKEQGGICIYTGKTIGISNLLNGECDIEHTIPRSQSFDNSLANKTLCDSHYNRQIKQNKIPFELTNDYPAIIKRIEPWIGKAELAKKQVEFWKGKSKKATTKEFKDSAIRQRHLWQMEYSYWKDKVERFTCTEIKSGFKNSQLIDTQIITKYALAYLKSAFNRVEAQTGKTTSIFRSILGIGEKNEKKDRSNHYHHAVDAAILTLIPSAAKREKILKLYFEKTEMEDLGKDSRDIVNRLKEEVDQLRIGNQAAQLLKHIEETIYIQHCTKERTLTPTKRKFKNSKGETCYATGDAIRGQLHAETWLGKIRIPEFNSDGEMVRDNEGRIILSNNYRCVTRKMLSSFKSLDEIEKVIVDKALFEMIKQQCEGKSYSSALESGIYMFKKNGDKANKIRHIRCYVRVSNPLEIKKHTYPSKYPYKQSYYADMGNLYVMAKYENEEGKKNYEIYSLYDVSNNMKNNLPAIPEQTIDKKGNIFKLTHTIQSGQLVLVYDTIEELKELNNLQSRLYVVDGFENDGKRIRMIHHCCAKDAKELGAGATIGDFNHLPNKIRCGINGINFLIEGKDFNLKNNIINFLE